MWSFGVSIEPLLSLKFLVKNTVVWLVDAISICILVTEFVLMAAVLIVFND
jgi:hypothetical protein